MELFYAPEVNKITTLSQEESRHCVKVLRHRRGEVINIIDGKGNLFEAVIVDANPRATVVEIEKKTSGFGKVPYELAVALPPLKNSARYEWFVEKAVEIGITEIIPMRTRYTERLALKKERLEKILVSAAKQSLRAKIPQLYSITDFEHILNMEYEQRFIAVCDASETLIKKYTPGQKAIILIGPEGGFSEEEIKLATESEFVPIRIGNSRLRAETAAVVATSVICNLNLF